MEFIISSEEKKTLLEEARETIAAKLERRQPLYGSHNGAALSTPCGSFVTLRTRGTNKLRGCIGRMIASTPLIQTVRTMALESAFEDPRFPPLTMEELSETDIEISALSPMESCHDSSSVKVGVHGLYLRHRGRSGVLLPQVPTEQGWNQQEYLEYICVKAGLPPLSYKESGAELFTFTAVVFAETEEQ